MASRQQVDRFIHELVNFDFNWEAEKFLRQVKNDVYDLFGGSVSERFGMELHACLINRSLEISTVVYLTRMSNCGSLDILKLFDISLDSYLHPHLIKVSRRRLWWEDSSGEENLAYISGVICRLFGESVENDFKELFWLLNGHRRGFVVVCDLLEGLVLLLIGMLPFIN